MLGLARAAQYAGWGAVGSNIRLAMTSPADMQYAVYQEPVFSFLFNASDRNWSVAPGDFDLTGYSSLSGFNRARFSTVMNLYLPWPSDLEDGYYGTPIAVELRQTGQDTIFYSWNLNITESGNLEIQASMDNSEPRVLLPGSYTLYTERWLTVVCSSAETDSVFENFVPAQTFGTNRMRIAVYDAETGEKLAQRDEIVGGRRPDIAAYGTTVGTAFADADSAFISGFSGGNQQIRQSGIWCSFGTMFDPETETDDTWRTTRPGAVVGNAAAWLNATATTTLQEGGDFPNRFFMDQHTDRFVPDITGQRVQITGGGQSAFDTGFSNTIFVRSRG